MNISRCLWLLAAAWPICAQQIDYVQQVQKKPMADAREYAWFRTNGSGAAGTLTSAGSNTVTLTPCPKGVSGATSNYMIRVYDGTGTAEAVPVTGGTCTSAAASGTLIVTTSNTHSGSWKLGSATGGIAEARYTVGCPVAVQLAAGTTTVYGTFDMSGCNGFSLIGSGSGSSVIDIAHASNDFIVWRAQTDDVTLHGFKVKSSVTRTGGWVLKGIAPYNNPALLRWSHIDNITVRNQVNGFWLTNYAGVNIDRIVMEDFLSNVSGVGIKAGQTATTDVNQGSELHITNTHIYGSAAGGLTPALGYGFWIEDTDAVYLGPSTSCGLTTQGIIRYVAGPHGLLNHFLNQFISDGGTAAQGAAVLFTGTGTLTDIMIDNSWFASSGVAGAGTTTAAGLKITAATIGRLEIRNSRFFANQGPGIYIDGPTNTGGGPMLISNNTFTQNGVGNQVGYRDDIFLNFPFDLSAPFVTGNVHTGSANGFSIRTSNTTNFLRLGTNHWQNGFSFGITPRSGLTLPITPTSTTIGGAPLAAGACTAAVLTTVTGASVGMSVTATPGVSPGGAFFAIAWVSAADVVSTQLCSVSAATPSAQSYYLRVTN